MRLSNVSIRHETKIHVANSLVTASKLEKTSLVKQSPEAIKKLAESKTPTKQDGLLGTPEVMLAQANAHSITFHRLVQENEDQKKTITDLSLKIEALEKVRNL